MSDDWHRMSALALGSGIESGAIDPARARRVLPRTDRGDRPRPRDLPAAHRRPRPRRGRGRSRTRQARPQALAARRRADLVEGPLRQRRRRHGPRHAGAGRPRGRARRHGAGARHPRRPGLPRQDQPVGVRLLHPGAQSQDRHPRPIPSTRPRPACRADRPPAPPSLSRAGSPRAAIGSDTGGSVRVPAAWNGLVGLKTSVGRLPLGGVLGLSTSMDTAGPLTARRGRCSRPLRRARRADRRRQPARAGPRRRHVLPHLPGAADDARLGVARCRRRGRDAGRDRAPCVKPAAPSRRRRCRSSTRPRLWSAASAPITPPSATPCGTTTSRRGQSWSTARSSSVSAPARACRPRTPNGSGRGWPPPPRPSTGGSGATAPWFCPRWPSARRPSPRSKPIWRSTRRPTPRSCATRASPTSSAAAR